MSITILECREADATTSSNIGDWETILAQPLVIEKGDQVLLKNCIVDTTTITEDNIIVESDTDLTFVAYPYITNYQYKDKSYFTGIEVAPQPNPGNPISPSQPDSERYYACLARQNNPHRVLQEMEIEAVKLFPSKFADIDAFTFDLKYYTPEVLFTNSVSKDNNPVIPVNDMLPLNADRQPFMDESTGFILFSSTADDSFVIFDVIGTNEAGNPQTETLYGPTAVTITSTINKYKTLTSVQVTANPTTGIINVGVSKASKLATIKLSCPHKATSIQNRARQKIYPNIIIGSSQYPDPVVVVSSIPQLPPDKGGNVFPRYNINVTKMSEDSISGYFEPQEFKHEMTIKQGNYSPTILCQIINDSLTQNTSNGVNLLDNDMLKKSDYLGAETTLFLLKESNPTQAEADGFTLVNPHWNPTQRRSWIGSSQFELAYDESTKTFRWDYLHTPFFSGNPGEISVKYEIIDNKYTTTSSSFGVALASVSPDSFFEDLLGFNTKTSKSATGSDEDDLQCHTTVSNSLTEFTVGGVTARFPTFSTKVGTSTTSQFVGSDTVVQKTPDPYYVPEGDSFTSTLDADNTDKIIARTPISQLNKSDTTGYFYLDITSNFQTSFLNTNGVSRSMSGVITRYENTGSYTIGSSDAGILYTHVGEPQVLQSLKIRILNPDKTLASNSSGIGSDNTVLLQVVKNAG
jgi:hypothetical protein